MDYQSELSLSLSSMLFSFSSNCLFFSLCVSQRLRNKSSPTAAYFPVKHTRFFLFFFLLNLLAFQVAISFYFGHDQGANLREKSAKKNSTIQARAATKKVRRRAHSRVLGASRRSSHARCLLGQSVLGDPVIAQVESGWSGCAVQKGLTPGVYSEHQSRRTQ